MPKHTLPLAAVGPDACLAVTFNTLETVETWVNEFAGRTARTWDVTFDRLDALDRRLIVAILEQAVTSATPTDVLNAYPLSEIANMLRDEICILLHGRTFADEIAWRQAQLRGDETGEPK